MKKKGKIKYKYYIYHACFKDGSKDIRFAREENIEKAKLEFSKKVRQQIQDKIFPYTEEPESVDVFECVDFFNLTNDISDIYYEHIF